MKMLFILFVLIALCVGDTAKEAHDKTTECLKKCARITNILKCEMKCRGEGPQEPQPQRVKANSKKLVRDAKKVHPPLTKQVKSKPTTIKGRRVFLIRKQ